MEGREREVHICELGNMACHRWLTCQRGERGRCMFVSLEMRHMANKNPLAGEKEEGGVGW